MRRLFSILLVLLLLTGCAPQSAVPTAVPSAEPVPTLAPAPTPEPTAEDALHELLDDYAPQSLNMFRPFEPIVAATPTRKTFHQLALSWGVTPVLCPMMPSTEVLFYTAKNLAKEHMMLQSGDDIVITGGITNGQSGNTNTIKIDRID